MDSKNINIIPKNSFYFANLNKFIYLLPYLTSGQGARTTISPSLTRRLDLITRGIRTFSLDNVSSDKTIATVSKMDVISNTYRLLIWGL